jgi:hypothetical protein
MLLTTAFAIHFRETDITSLPHMILGKKCVNEIKDAVLGKNTREKVDTDL